jgi:hypothetical protein
MAKSTTKASSRHEKKSPLIPVVSDLASLSRCAARTISELANRRSPNLATMTLGDLRSALERDLVQLEEAIEEIDLLILEQGKDKKALQLDLKPEHLFAKIRAKCAACD